jgi:hypothetical protein
MRYPASTEAPMKDRDELDVALQKALKLLEQVSALADRRSTDLREGPTSQMLAAAHSTAVNLAMAKKCLDDAAADKRKRSG